MARTRGEDRANRESEASYRAKLGDKIGAAIKAANFNRYMTRNATMTSAAVAIGTAPAKARTGATLTFKIAGALKSKVATDDFWTLTGGNLADGFTRKYALLIDAAGAASVLASNDATTAAGCVFDPVALFKKGGLLESKAVVGILTVATSGAAFVPGTTSLAAATVTDTYLDGLDPSMVPAGVDPL